MSKPKIAIVVSHPIQHFCPQYESFAKYEGAITRIFFGSALGYKPYLDSNFKQEIFWSNLKLESFDHVFLNGDIVLPVTRELDAPTLSKELTLFSPDLIVVYGYFQKIQRSAYRWARKHNIPIAYISDSERRQQRSFLKECIKYPYLKLLFSKISYFLTVGNANEEYYQYYGVSKQRFIRMHFPIDINLYKSCYDQRDTLRSGIRQQYGIRADETTLCVVGKLVSWKNQDHLIEAMKILETQQLYVHLFMVGSGDKMEEWGQKAVVLKKSRVHFTGFVNADVLPAYYAASDIYIHPASVEPHSIAISEAIYMGCPIIISSTCGSFGSSDDVQEEMNGYVYEFGDVEKLAALIKTLISDQSKRQAMGNYSHQLGVKYQQISHNQTIEKLVEAIEDSKC